MNDIVLVQIHTKVQKMYWLPKLYFICWKFNTKFHCFDIELTDKVNEGPFGTSPDSNAVVDKAFPEPDSLDEGEFRRHFDE